MSSVHRSPKIPLSPSSPPETGLKRRRESDSETKRPPSPEFMSVATKSYNVHNHHTQNMDETASRSSPRSPASSASYNNSLSQRPSQPYSTPASSVSGIPGLGMIGDLDQHRDKRQRTEPLLYSDESPVETQTSMLPTNHDRSVKNESDDATNFGTLQAEQRETEIVETLAQLQTDMGEPFLVCRSKPRSSNPSPSQHLLGIYGLSSMMADIIRNDPVTGEKINRLRKSYEGQIKTFALSGRNKPVACERKKEPAEEEEPGPLRRTVGSSWKGLQTEADWERSRQVPEINVDESFKQSLRKALHIEPGEVRNPSLWDELLGHDKQRPTLPTPVVPQPQSRVSNPPAQARAHREVAEAKRTTRGKKRSYDDGSFVGYGDGYSDVEDAGARDDEDDLNTRKKRRF